MTTFTTSLVRAIAWGLAVKVRSAVYVAVDTETTVSEFTDIVVDHIISDLHFLNLPSRSYCNRVVIMLTSFFLDGDDGAETLLDLCLALTQSCFTEVFECTGVAAAA